MAEPETVHHWVIFGRDTVYLSHLSMFSMPQHAIQVIVSAKFSAGDVAAVLHRPDGEVAVQVTPEYYCNSGDMQ